MTTETENPESNGRPRAERLDDMVSAETVTARNIAQRLYEDGDRRAAHKVAEWYDVPLRKVRL